MLSLSRLKLLAGDTAGGLEVLARLGALPRSQTAEPIAELELARRGDRSRGARRSRSTWWRRCSGTTRRTRGPELALELVTRPETCVRAAELVLESASATGSAAHALALGALLETTEPLSKLDSAPSELAALRQGWLTQALSADA